VITGETVAPNESPIASRAASRPIVSPGIVFYSVTLGALVLAVDANTRGSLDLLLVTAPIWLAIAIVWVLRLLLAGGRARWRLSAAEWARWLVIPLAMGGVFAITRTDALINARLDLSRGAMDAMAADVLAGGPTNRGWVGLYDVGAVDVTGNGLRFVVDAGALGRWGFAYATAGEPVFIDDEEEAAGLWTGARFESIGGGWWRWIEEWD